VVLNRKTLAKTIGGWVTIKKVYEMGFGRNCFAQDGFLKQLSLVP